MLHEKTICILLSGHMSLTNDTIEVEDIFYQDILESQIDQAVAPSLSSLIQANNALAQYNMTLTEKNLIQFAQEYICLYIKDVDFSKYDPRISTFVSISGENSAWGETKESFYLANSEHERVMSYDVVLRPVII